MKHIYLDHAASTEIAPEIKSSISKSFLEDNTFGNPSSIHHEGQKAKTIIDQARFTCAKLLESKPEEIFFTSGATESLHMAIIGGYLGLKKHNHPPLGGIKGGQILISPLSHSAIWNACNFLEKNFQVQIKLLPITKEGSLDLDLITEETLKNTDLVVVEHGNSEIGVLQPVTKIGKKILKLDKKDRPLFIIDAAASIVTEKVALSYLKADFITLSGEKFGGLSGTGLLIKKAETEMQALQGGSQEFGYRGGSENILGIEVLAKALEMHLDSQDKLKKHLEILHKFTGNYFEKHFPDLKVITPTNNFMPHIFHFMLPENRMADLFVVQCDLKGLCISAGSACSSGTITGSKVLTALDYKDKDNKRGVRLSFGRATTKKELEEAFKIIDETLYPNLQMDKKYN